MAANTSIGEAAGRTNQIQALIALLNISYKHKPHCSTTIEGLQDALGQPQ
jgi:hypothetical protein